MSKTKKFLTAVVSVVMSGAMVFGFTACGPDDPGPGPGPGPDDPSGITTVTPETPAAGASQTVLPLTVSTDNNKKLAYSSGTNLDFNMGQNGTYTISFRSNRIATGTAITLPDGKEYTTNDLKPAWATMSEKLDVTIDDVFTALDSSQQITQAVADRLLGTYTMISGNATEIVNEGAANGSFLDLSLYLDYMPNYKKFLEDNPVVRMSLTSDTELGSMYYAPYFDGNDDIEKYELANQHWVVALLDNDTAGTSTTFAAQAAAKVNFDDTARYKNPDGTSASVESYMGTTGSWWVETTASKEDTSEVVKVYINYDDALAAAKEAGSALNTALTAAGVNVANLSSGNIVDLQNAAINTTNGAVTGKQLLDILRAYIDVAYQDESGAKFYDTRSDVFNGYNAAWDVDLLVALSRCIVTNRTALNDNSAITDGQLFALSARQGTTQRQNDLTGLAGELYGVRGLSPRYLNTYIDSDGEIYDSRAQEDMWVALDNLHAMVEEGLLYTGTNNASGKTSYYSGANAPVVFMIYDYVQTQTANGGFAMDGLTTIDGLPEDYNFAPILTPVSKWDDGDTSTGANVDGISYCYDGSEKYMRFTESWRSVKNTGFGIPYDNVKDNPERLSAALAVIDYMFSNDGQFVMTYGQMSSTNSATENADGTWTSNDNGWWYGTEVTNVNLTDVAEQVPGSDQYTVKDEYAGQYFIYENKVYTGTYYNGKMQPTMTTANLQFYLGNEVNGLQLAKADTSMAEWGYARNYTNYARGVIGSAQPMGNKLQSFEYQCTPTIGIEGANKVAASLVNGTISHVYLQLDNAKDNYWYTIVPTTLPYDSNTASYIGSTYTTLTNTVFAGSGSTPTNFANDVVWYGLGSGQSLPYAGVTVTMPADAAGCVTMLTENFGNIIDYVGLMQQAWGDLMEEFG